MPRKWPCQGWQLVPVRELSGHAESPACAIREYGLDVPLKPQDVVVMLRLLNMPVGWTIAQLARGTAISASEVHAALKRALAATLYMPHARAPARANLLEFLLHGIHYAFPVERGPLTLGVPTSHAASPLRERLRQAPADDVPVWPDPDGDTRGEAWSPLYPTVPDAARRDPWFHETLALVDALRGGRARERTMAANELTRRLQ